MTRKEDRYRTSNTALLSGPNIPQHEVSVRDVSKKGARVISDGASLLVGELVYLNFGDTDMMQGTIRWRSGNEIGISIDQNGEPR